MPRRHVYVLAAIALVGLIRGGYWIAMTEVWNPIDEAHHYSYVQSLATGEGLPTAGKDRVSREVLAVNRDSPTSGFSLFERKVDPHDPAWGAEREQYEAVQPPLYYVLMVPAYWVSHPFGVIPSIYALRLASVLLSLLAVPLAWMLARQLFPRRPWVWLAAPAVLVFIEGFNANFASISNDSLVAVTAVPPLIVMARAWHGLTRRRAIAAGAFLGLAILTKTTVVGVILLMGLVLLAVLVTRRASVASVLGFGVLLGGATVVVVAPWLIWNLVTYGALSGAEAVTKINGPGHRLPFDFDSLGVMLRGSRIGFWDFLRYTRGPNRYTVLFEVALTFAAVGGVVAAVRRRRADEARGVAWTALAYPAAYLGMVGIVFTAFGGTAEGVVGRHLYLAIVPACVCIAAGAFIALGRRPGVVALVALIGLALVLEHALVQRYVDGVYTEGVRGTAIPVVDQHLNEKTVPGTFLTVRAPCAAELIGVQLQGAPGRVELMKDQQVQALRRVGEDRTYTLYRVSPPQSGPFSVHFSQPVLVASAPADGDTDVTVETAPLAATARVWCSVADPKGRRFAQLYPPLHPKFVRYRAALLWPWLWLAGIVGAAVAVTVLQRREREPSVG